MTKNFYPIAVIDLETKEVKNWERSSLRKLQPLIVGLLIAHSPRKMIYTAFSGKECKKLEQKLVSFEGPILSFNGLRFDFIVLEKKITIQSVLRYSFDLFYWLQSKTGMKKGSRLEDLAQENLGMGKIGSWQDGIRAWRKGKRTPMVRYNRMDCHLTLKLFLRLAKQGHLLFQGKKIFTSLTDRKQFLGQSQQVTYEQWLNEEQFTRSREIKEAFTEADGGFWEGMLEAMGHDPDEIKEIGVERLLRSHAGEKYVECSCGKFFTIAWTEWPGSRQMSSVLCPNCNRSLGNFDLDNLHEVTKDEYLIIGKHICPKDRMRLKFVRHFVYKPGSEEWDVFRCPKCRVLYETGIK